MQKVLAIVGPTAIGKTEFGIRCAEAFYGEIISGDSIQVYRGLDIGSAKPSKEELSAAVHHLIDIKDPDENYSVREFQKLCREMINLYGVIDQVDENQWKIFSSVMGEEKYVEGLALAIKMYILEQQGISCDIVSYTHNFDNFDN